jgi:hypothetical protein
MERPRRLRFGAFEFDHARCELHPRRAQGAVGRAWQRGLAHRAAAEHAAWLERLGIGAPELDRVRA